MSQNLCTPSNVYGPFEQTLFCGASIMSFSATAGWNESASEVIVNLVEDECAGHTRVLWSQYGEKLTTTQADNFIEPIVGAPAYFRVGEFEFCGLVQSWKRINNTGGKPTFEVRLTDPREILAGAQVIIGDYTGPVADTITPGFANYGIYNLFNVYGFVEQYISCLTPRCCPLTTYNGGVFGSYSSRFGGADLNENGMPWYKIAQGLSIMTSAIPKVQNNFGLGRLYFTGPTPVDAEGQHVGYGLLWYDWVGFFGEFLCEYYLDLSLLPTAPIYWRIKGTSVSILELISYICQQAGVDYYIELVPVIVGGQVLKIIKVRTVSRTFQPPMGAIEAFIANADNPVTTNSYGRELRNEDSNAFLIGGKRQDIYQAFHGQEDDIIEPYWGLDSFGNAIEAELRNPSEPHSDENEYLIPFDLSVINIALQGITDDAGSNYKFNSATISDYIINGTDLSIYLTENELRAAIRGYDNLLSYSLSVDTALGKVLKLTYSQLQKHEHIIGINKVIDEFLAAIAAGNRADLIAPRHLITVPGDKDKASPTEKCLEIVYRYVSSYAHEHYGRKFQIHLPYTCAYFNTESQTWYTSEEPATDGGWTEYTTIIGLPHLSHENYSLTNFFALDEKGKIGPIVRFYNADNLDYENYSLGEFGIYPAAAGGYLYTKASIDPLFVYGDISTFTSPRAVLTIPRPVTIGVAVNDLNKELGLIQLILKKKGKDFSLSDIAKTVGNGNLSFGIEGLMEVPDAAAVPLRSNTTTYGPWVNAGLSGKVRVESDENLVPWEYGGFSVLNAAATSRVSSAVTKQRIGEHGSITVAGYPTIPLGSEIGANTTNYFINGKHLIENRNKNDVTIIFTDGTNVTWTTATFSYEEWTGAFGANITSISVEVGPQGVQTTYTLRTFTPQFGRFSKAYEMRLGQIGQQRIRNMKAFTYQKFSKALKNAINEGLNKEHRRSVRKDKHAKGSPVEVIVGQQLSFSKNMGSADKEFRQSLVEILPLHESSSEFLDYDKKAFMSLDGLLRPVSISGGGCNLPQYPLFDGALCDANGKTPLPHLTAQSYPIVNGYTPPTINRTYLNPFVNPDDFVTPGEGGLPRNTAKHGTSDGHDIDILGRGTSPPTGSLSIPLAEQAGHDEGYNQDYRFLALRGPLVLHSWGYDTNGKPIPNKADSETSIRNGTYVDVGLQDTFMNDWLRKSNTWPVAPVDLRYDRKRGVWTVPTQFHVLLVTADAQISAGTNGLATINAPNLAGKLYKADGNIISGADMKIKLWNPFNSAITAGQQLSAYYDSTDCKYYPMVGGGGGGECNIIHAQQQTVDLAYAIECYEGTIQLHFKRLYFNTCGQFVQALALTGPEA